MNRRTLLGMIGAGAAGSVAGCSESDQADAVNVEDAEPLEDASGVEFGEDVSVSWIHDRFIENPDPENPVVGTEIRFTAMVLTNLQSEQERLQIANGLSWKNFEFGGKKIMGPLFEPVSWALEPVKNLTEEFYEKFKVMKVVGVADADQEFFDKYGMAPFVWTFSEDDAHYYPSGTLVEFEGTVEFADPEEDHFAPGMGKERFYVEVTGSRETDSLRSLWEDSPVGERTTFTGLHYQADSTMTSYLTEVDYEFRHELPRPVGGSLVTHTGPLQDREFEVETLVRDNEATMETTRQEVIVGDTTTREPPSGGTETDAPDGTAPRDAPTNVVAVVDVSGSMSDQDTRSGASRLTVAKESAKALVNYVESGNRLGTVAFSTEAEVVTSLREVTDANRDRFLADVDALATRNDTSIGGGLLAALEELRDARGPKSIVLLSDGQQNEPPTVSEVLPELKNLGVTVYTIGMGSDVARNLLEEIANETGGDSRFAPNPEEIRSFYQQFAISAQERSTLAETTEELTEREETSATATVDESCEDVQFSLSYPGSTISLEVERPDGEPLAETGDVSRRVSGTSEVWTVEDPPTGEWTVTAVAEQLDRPEEASVRVSSDSPVGADLFVSRDVYEQTGMMRLEVKVTRGFARYTGGDVRLFATTGDGEAADGATAEGTAADGATADGRTEIRLRDDGGGPDPVADDGIYTGYFHPPDSGTYEFTVDVAGGDVEGLRRTFQREVTVAESVEEPTKPYADHSTTSPIDRVTDYAAPAGLVGGGLAVVWGMLRMLAEDDQ